MKFKYLGIIVATISLMAQLGCWFGSRRPDASANHNSSANDAQQPGRMSNSNRFLGSRPPINTNKPGGPRHKPSPQ